jgi:transposase
MATKRLTMRNIREILRLHFEAKLSLRKISICTKASVGGVQKLLAKVKQCELVWPLADDMDDVQLAKLLYPKSDPTPSRRFELPDWVEVHQELRAKGVSKQLLWEEYTQQYPNRSYSYSQYCHHYEVWRAKQRRSMRQIHKAGEKLFIDYAGQTVPIVSGSTGEVRRAQIFVAVMGASIIPLPKRPTVRVCLIGLAVIPEPSTSWAAYRN